MTGAWQHLAVTFDGATIRTYVNGLLRNTTTPPFFNGDVRFLKVGANRNSSKFFSGSIDDVRVYGRALTAAEVAALAGGQP